MNPATHPPVHPLNALLHRVAEVAAGGEAPVVVFDLDHTVFDNGPRTHAILRDFARDEGDELLRERLRGLPDLGLPYLMTDVLALVDERRAEVIDRARAAWVKRFFTDDLQRLDVPVAGAVEYVNATFQAGATVVYLSGRDVPKMLVGCTESLRHHGFPVGLARTATILKPTFEMADLAFKRDVIGFVRTLGRVVGAFDNEPANCNLFRQAFPEAFGGFMTTAMAPGAPPLDDGIVHLADFRRPGAPGVF